MPEKTVYVLVPGWVRSKRDGDLRWVGAVKLAQLYGVPLRECVVHTGRGHAVIPEGAVRLGPDPHGRYELPQE